MAKAPIDLQRIETDQRLLLGQLTAGVAHELNNPIGYIASNLGTLNRYVASLVELVECADALIPDPQREAWQATLQRHRWDFLREDLPELLRDSSEGADLLKRVVADLKTIGRSGSRAELANPNDCLRSALSMLRHQLKRGYEVEEELKSLDAIPLVRAQIIQAVTNLVHNAIQAMEEDPGKLLVTSSLDGEHVVLAVEDDGPGVPEDIRDSIFQPRYTTKDSRSGSGLGLPIVDEIARYHRGSISLRAPLRLRGARFELRLLQAGPEEQG